MPYAYRDLTAGDGPHLLEMLRLAVGWRPPELGGTAAPVAVPPRAFADLGRPGDGGVVVEYDSEPAGACWYRLVPAGTGGTAGTAGTAETAGTAGDGHAGPGVPELTVAVRPEHRANGIGGELLDRAIAQARAAGVGALALSVERDNPARGMYERRGFAVVGEEHGSLTMRLTLDA